MRVFAIALAVIGLAAPAAANPVDLHGFGARAPAMAGAQTAATSDTGANYYNPAALARIDELRFDVGWRIARPTLRLNGIDQRLESSRGLSLGMVIPGWLGGRRITLGAGLFLPDQQVLLGRSFAAAEPRWAIYDHKAQRVFVGTNLALRFGSVSIGGGLAFVADTTGTYALSGRLGFPDGADSDLALDVDVDATTASYPQAGVLWQAASWLRLGATYRGQFVLESIQIISFDADIGPAEQPAVEDAYLAIDSFALDLFQPAQLALGFAAQVTHRLLVAGDVTYKRWSAFANPTPDIMLSLDLGDFNDLVDIPDAPPLEPPRFSDTLAVRLGAELVAVSTTHTAVQLRAGYAYEPTPAPEQVAESNFVDNDKHTVALGAGVSLRDVTELLPLPFDIDAYVAVSLLPERNHRKLSATDPVGDYVSGGWIVSAGVSSSWRF